MASYTVEVFQHAVVQMVILAVIVACGFIARKKRLMNDTFDTMLSQLVMSVTLPALILDSVLSSTQLPSAHDIGLTLGYAALYFLLIGSVSFLITRVVYRGVPPVTRGAHEFMMIYGNTGFLGYAVLAAVLDPSAVLYAAIFNIVFNITVFSYGVMLVSGDKPDARQADQRDGSAEPAPKKHSWRDHARALGRTLTKPALIASYIAVVLAICGITDSGPISQTCDLLGGMTVPAAMLVIGSSIAKMPIKEMLFDKWSYLTAAIRLIVAPLLVFGVFRLFTHDAFILAIMVMLAAMPVASNGTMLCLAYRGDTRAVARGTFLTTIFSMITLPLIALLVV